MSFIGRGRIVGYRKRFWTTYLLQKIKKDNIILTNQTRNYKSDEMDEWTLMDSYKIKKNYIRRPGYFSKAIKADCNTEGVKRQG